MKNVKTTIKIDRLFIFFYIVNDLSFINLSLNDKFLFHRKDNMSYSI